MSIAHAMLGEFEHEASITRKFLERVPPDKLMWKAHEKSHTVGELAMHIAITPGLVVLAATMDESPMPEPGVLFRQPATVQEIISGHDKSVATVKATLPGLDDARLMTNWSAVREGKPVMTMPRLMFLRAIMLNHWIQHRGQLGVYLRLTGAKVPASYGPSGDEG